MTKSKQIKVKTPSIYSHAFDLAFSVDTFVEDPYELLSKDKGLVKRALMARVESLFEDDEYLEGLGHFDSYETETYHMMDIDNVID